MVRRSTVDRSPHSPEHGLDDQAGTEYSGRDQAEALALGANLGRSGRPLARLGLPRDRLGRPAADRLPGRCRDLVERVWLGPAVPVASAPAASGFPVTLADAYALQFGQVYLNYSPHNAGQRAAQIGTFLPSGSDPQLGWNGRAPRSCNPSRLPPLTCRTLTMPW